MDDCHFHTDRLLMGMGSNPPPAEPFDRQGAKLIFIHSQIVAQNRLPITTLVGVSS
jgi:hypothetical protein